MTLRPILLPVLLAAGVTTLPAAGESPRETAAEALFRQAREDMRQGAFEKAYRELVESQRMGPSNGALLNLMICEERVGKIASAWLHGRTLVERLDPSDDRMAIAARHVAALSARVPTLIVRLGPSIPAHGVVLLDGLALGRSSLSAALPIDPGPHQLVVSVPEREDRVVSIDVAEARVYEETLEASEPPPRKPAVESSPAPSPDGPHRGTFARAPDRPSSSRAVGWPALATGIAGLVASGVLGILTLDRQQVVRSACPDKQCRDSSGLQAADEGRLLSAGAVVALSAGLAGTGLGLYFLTGGPSPLPGGAAQPAPLSGARVAWQGAF